MAGFRVPLCFCLLALGLLVAGGFLAPRAHVGTVAVAADEGKDERGRGGEKDDEDKDKKGDRR